MASTLLTNKLASEIYQVLVYQQQARITRIVNTSVVKGSQQLVLTGIPNSIDTSTIQVKGKGDFTILGIRYEQRNLEKNQYPAKLKDLENAVDSIEDKLLEIEDKLYLIKQEEDFLKNNKKIGGVNETISVEQMREMSNFMNQVFSQLISNRQKANKVKKQLEEDKVILSREFEERLELNSRSNTEILLDVDANSESEAIFTIEYIVKNAGWYADYDVRANSNTEDLKISYKANVYQNTGEVWDAIKLTVSSGNPSLNNTKPVLTPWYIYAERPEPASPKMMKKSVLRSSAPQKERMMESMDELEIDEIEISVGGSVQSHETAININYEIDASYNIPANGEPVAIGLLKFDPKSEFAYSAIPKIDHCAFLTAKVLDWDSSNLLSGNMNIYLDDAFVGKSYLNTKTTDQDIIVSLGRDERIQTTREQLKHVKSDASFIGNKKKEQFNFQIKIKNSTQKKISVLIEDNLPVSKDSDINVKVGETACFLSHSYLCSC